MTKKIKKESSRGIKKSLRLLQVEKMVIILKELQHIRTILDFFNGYNKYQNINTAKVGRKKDKEDNKPNKKNLAILQNDISNVVKQIEELRDISNDLMGKEDMLFIIQYDYIRTQIEDMLRVIQALYNKMQQLFGETLNQYLPYPILGRRYSNNGIMMYLGNYYREMHKKFSKEEMSKIVLGWNYRTGFHYRIFVNRELKRENYKENTYNDYIDLPYWYYELPILLPSITHEVAYISLRNPSKNIKKPYENLKENLRKFLDDKNNLFVQKVQDILAYKEYGEDLAKVIFCDVVGYHTHGKSYVNALFHDILGEKLAKDYLKIKYDKKNEKSFEFISNEWFFIQKKDHSILRLHFLLQILPKDTEFNEMKALLDSLMPLDNEDKLGMCGFSKIYYYDRPNLKASYLSVQNYLSQVLETLTKWYDDNKRNIKKIEKYSEENETPKFNQIWKARYRIQEKEEDMVVHQNIFRRLIHTNVSGGISYLKENEEAIEKNDESIIYLMELGKARKDIPSQNKNNQNSNINKCIGDEINEINSRDGDDENSQLNLAVYGIYDWLTIKKKEPTLDVSQKFNELLEHAQIEHEPYDLKYFKSKQVLMKVHEGFQGENSVEIDQFSVVFNIEVAKKIDIKTCTNGYNNLDKIITNIAKKLENNQKYYKRADIYKSLGPKDITIVLQNATLQSIFKLLEDLNQERNNVDTDNEEGEILRTFTMLCSSFGSSAILSKNFSLVSYLRVSNSFQKKNIDFLKDKEKMHKLTEATGIMDFRIRWKDETKISEVLDFYNRMTAKSYLSDFQTKIEKEISLL